ncbi:MAG: MFS transporter [Anaerolineales bacterium]|nr:MFS transporter [Anaerolineales bacterium]
MPPKLTLREKWIYGSGDLSFSLTSTIVGAFFAIYLTDVVGVPAAVAALAIFVGGTWDYINDPIVGYLSDRTRSRWGRRRPFLLFGAVPLMAAFALMWWRPPIADPLWLGAYFSLMYLVYELAATFAYIPFIALTPELTADYDERTALMSTRAFFSILGSLIAFTVPLMIVGTFRPENAGRILAMGAVIGAFCVLPLWLVFFGTRERKEFMRRPPKGLRESIAALRRNPPFVFNLVIYLFTWVTVAIIQLIMLYYIKHVVRQEANNDLIMATIFIVAMAALPLWEWISRRLNKRWAYILGTAFLAAVLLALSALDPSIRLPMILAICVLAGIGVSAAHIVPWSMLPDAIEYGELQSGERHEGMYYSLISLAQKIAVSIALPLALLVLDRSGYVPGNAAQPESAVNGIRLIAGPIPAVLLGLGILFAVFYPLGRENYTEIARTLEARRAKADPAGPPEAADD